MVQSHHQVDCEQELEAAIVGSLEGCKVESVSRTSDSPMRMSDGAVSATDAVVERLLLVRDSAGRLRLFTDSAFLKTCTAREVGNSKRCRPGIADAHSLSVSWCVHLHLEVGVRLRRAVIEFGWWAAPLDGFAAQLAKAKQRQGHLRWQTVCVLVLGASAHCTAGFLFPHRGGF